jgi:hypothetical protein
MATPRPAQRSASSGCCSQTARRAPRRRGTDRCCEGAAGRGRRTRHRAPTNGRRHTTRTSRCPRQPGAPPGPSQGWPPARPLARLRGRRVRPQADSRRAGRRRGRSRCRSWRRSTILGRCSSRRTPTPPTATARTGRDRTDVGAAIRRDPAALPRLRGGRNGDAVCGRQGASGGRCPCRTGAARSGDRTGRSTARSGRARRRAGTPGSPGSESPARRCAAPPCRFR